EKAESRHDRPSAVDDTKGSNAWTRTVEANQRLVWTLAHVLHHATDVWDSCRCLPGFAGIDALQAEGHHQRGPCLRFGPLRGNDPLLDHAALAAEVREIQAQDAEEAGPALLRSFDLVVPLIRAREQTVHDANDADAPGPRFDTPFRGDRRRIWGPAGSF